METDHLFKIFRTDPLKEDATITNVRGICLDNLEGIF